MPAAAVDIFRTVIAEQRVMVGVLSCAPCAAVEGSERMAEAAQSIIEENQLSSSQGGPISVVSGRVEELQALPMQQVCPLGAISCRKMPSWLHLLCNPISTAPALTSMHIANKHAVII